MNLAGADRQRWRVASDVLQEARWLIKNVQQRFDTILRVAQAIVDRQKAFFTHGEVAMRPLILREIADVLGLTIETVSRQTTRLKRAGLIDLPAGRLVTIRDRDALEERAEAA